MNTPSLITFLKSAVEDIFQFTGTLFNFVFGLNYLPNEIDVLNNPYINYVGMDINKTPEEFLNSRGLFTLEEKYEFELCSIDHLDKFIPK